MKKEYLKLILDLTIVVVYVTGLSYILNFLFNHPSKEVALVSKIVCIFLCPLFFRRELKGLYNLIKEYFARRKRLKFYKNIYKLRK